MHELLRQRFCSADAAPSASRHPLRIAALLGALLIVLSSATPTLAQVFHRWVDDQGNVHYSDVIPPTEVDKGRTILSPDGVRVNTVAPQRTPEQIQRDRELERLRAQQERLREQQRADDRVLLNSFQTVDDLIMTRDGNLSDIDTLIQFKKGNVRRQQDGLMGLRKEAADLERGGKPVPEQLRRRIASTERAIEDALAAIVEREQQKREIRAKFDRDLKRLRQLKQLPAEGPAEVAVAKATPVLENLIECADRTSCEELWVQAIDYVKRHATMPIESLGDDVLITQAPNTNQDIGLTVSRIWDEDGPGGRIFLDVQCRSYSPGQDKDCKTEAHTAVLRGFRSALQGDRRRATGMAVPRAS